MKISHHLLFATVFIVHSLAMGQSVACINSGGSGADASLGYHDYYNTEVNNYGGDLYLKAFCFPGASGGRNSNRGLIYFNTGFLSPSVQVINATMTLHASGYINNLLPGHFGNNASRLYRVTQPWQENSVTWNNQPSIAAADFSDLPQSNSSTQDYSIDVTSIATFHIQNPLQNFGYLLRLNQEDPNDAAALTFYSSDAPSTSKWPELCITYIDENDTVVTTIPSTVIPEFPNVLTINGDNVNDLYYLPQDLFQSFKVTILNRWGQTVYTNSGENGLLFWDGKSNQTKDYHEGVYYYLFEGILEDGELIEKSDFIHLVE